MNYRFKIPDGIYEYRRWTPVANIGVFTQITPKLRLVLLGFADIVPRATWETKLALREVETRRDLGGTLNLRYTLK